MTGNRIAAALLLAYAPPPLTWQGVAGSIIRAAAVMEPASREAVVRAFGAALADNLAAAYRPEGLP